MKNQNHPQPGTNLTVEPIRSLRHIKKISKLLADKPRDLLLFTMAINSGIRTGDLLRLKVSQVRGRKTGDTVWVKERKTGKLNSLAVNKRIHTVLQNFLQKVQPADDDWVFRSQKTGSHLSTQRVRIMVKQWCAAIGLRGRFGAHSLRKTFGYIQRTVYGAPLDVLCERFRHSSQQTTLRYLGITPEEVHNILMNEI